MMLIILCSTAISVAEWKAQPGPLATKWAKEVTPDNALPEYPRPQCAREEWLNLNGLWSYAIKPKDAPQPNEFDDQILVPFPIESSLSGVMKRVDEKQRLWYRRTFDVPAKWIGRRVLLQFGAVDWEAVVTVNGKEVGTHRGGYDPFIFDITDALKLNNPQEIVVAVWDPTDTGTQPRGKQVRKPESIWYTPTTGIWQTVWLEPVPEVRIDDLRITPDIDKSRVTIAIDGSKLTAAHSLRVVALEGNIEVAKATGKNTVELTIRKPGLWSPDEPHLYDLKLTLLDGDGKPVDEVSSYFGIRKISIGPDEKGVTRILLNNKPLFQFGPLDQGFWPDGLYTAPTDKALRSDIETTRQLGFNMIRKHVKVEPQRWYSWCDKLGLLVWQDLPSGDLDARKGREDLVRTPESAAQYETELTRMIATHYNSPCIVMWVPFNEGWGQFDTVRIAELTRKLDPTRLVNNASGWTDRKAGDVHDIHEYPGPASPLPEPKRAAVLGEFGGLGLPLAGHTWQSEKNWGYRSFKTPEELTNAYLALITQLRLLIAEPGLSAAVYTQTTDVEIEVNGLMPYDRALVKMDAERIAAANRKLYGPSPTVKTIMPTSEREPQKWRFTTDKPADDWFEPRFDDAKWLEGPGGFGSEGTPGIRIGTAWKANDIWLRRAIDAPAIAGTPMLRVFHDEDCEIYINGKKVAAAGGYVTNYVFIPLTEPAALKPGANVIAVHCKQTGGGQGIDVGIVDVQEPAAK
jgi:hypothetical protein